jgi:hypothetical protein
VTVITTLIWGDKISSYAHNPEPATDPAERIYGTMLMGAIDGTIEVIGNPDSPLEGAVRQLTNAIRDAASTPTVH